MRILLPPSEAKTVGGSGPSLRVAGFGEGPLAAALARPREQVLRAVAALCRDDPAAAVATLRLPASSAAADLVADTRVLDAPTAPALDRFTGVVYAALDVPSLPAAARVVADRSVLIASGAFGLLQADEPVPEHRVPMAANIPGIGGLASWWRRHVDPVAATEFGASAGPLVVDLRSSDYATVPTFTGEARTRVVVVRVLTEKRSGRTWARRVLSYQSKHGKGLFARALLLAEASAGASPGASAGVRTVDDVELAAKTAGFVVERRPLPGGRTGLDLVRRE